MNTALPPIGAKICITKTGPDGSGVTVTGVVETVFDRADQAWIILTRNFPVLLSSSREWTTTWEMLEPIAGDGSPAVLPEPERAWLDEANGRVWVKSGSKYYLSGWSIYGTDELDTGRLTPLVPASGPCPRCGGLDGTHVYRDCVPVVKHSTATIQRANRYTWWIHCPSCGLAVAESSHERAEAAALEHDEWRDTKRR